MPDRDCILTKKDFIYCEDCQMYVDFWKYDHNIDDAGHNGCNWRQVNDEELAQCIEDCKEPIPRCPKCDSIVDFEMTKGLEVCGNCGEPIDKDKVVYTCCLDEI